MVFCEKEKGVIHEDLKNEYCRFCGQEAGPLLRTNAGSLSTSRSGAIIPAQNIEVVDLSNDTSIPIIPALTALVQRFASFATNSKAVEATHQGSILKSKSISDLKSAGAGMGKHKKIIAETCSMCVIVGEKAKVGTILLILVRNLIIRMTTVT